MSKVEILKFAHFYNEGARGARGGAAQNDKIWGLAKVDNKLVRFWGRRNGVIKFKTHLLGQLGALNEEYGLKTGGRADGGDIYDGVKPSNTALIGSLVPNLAQKITSHFYSAMSTGKLNTKH